MSARFAFGLLAAVALVSLLAERSGAQAPELPPLPRLHGICLPTDEPGSGWPVFTAAALRIRISHPPGWRPIVVGARQIEFIVADRLMLRLRVVDTGGLTPLAWLQARVRTGEGQGCRVVAIGAFVGHQCFERQTQVWTTFLLTSRRVLAVEVPATVAREIHCAMLGAVEEIP